MSPLFNFSESPDMHTPPASFAYATGQPIEEGDRMQIGSEIFTVEHVILTRQDISEWGTPQAGLMLQDQLHELVFQPQGAKDWAEMRFLDRTPVNPAED